MSVGTVSDYTVRLHRLRELDKFVHAGVHVVVGIVQGMEGRGRAAQWVGSSTLRFTVIK